MSVLISSEEIERLAEEPGLRFVQLEQICRHNMDQSIGEHTSESHDSFMRRQYMATVSTAANELGIEGVPYVSLDMDIFEDVQTFILKVGSITTRLKLKINTVEKIASVRLAEGTRGKIEKQIQKLRTLVATEEMPEAKRKALLKHLDDLSVELSQHRVSFAKVMVALIAVSTICGGATTVFAEGPQAIANITHLIGLDKQAEDAEAQRLGAPPERKALPAPEPRRDRRAALARPTPLIDEDIPF